MEYLALYRKYRPQKFSDVIDQESTLKILINSIKEGHISHAYLFSGPRGTGKTTIAKLVAKTVNCLNLNDDFSICGKCENCKDILNNSSDIIEIDAASNNGVDEIRELKSKINLVPSKLKYKVYIIDEVHMLSISAFNALLKTLEEPPSHVIFILATTEFYKVPQTIVSRCQCLNFSRIKTSSIEKRLKEIALEENIKIESDAIHAIAEYSEGGMRDALGLLDKLASYSLENITLDDFLRINGLISKNDLDDFIDKILEKNNVEVIKTLNKFDELGIDFSKIIEKLMQELRDLMVLSFENKESDRDINSLYELIMCLNETYNLLRESSNRKIIVEVNLLKFMNKSLINSEKNLAISREISFQNIDNQEKKQKIIAGNMKKDLIKQPLNSKVEYKENIVKSKYEIDLEVERIRINNTFAKANKDLKKEAVSNLKKLDNYLVSEKYSYVAGILKDITLGVVSDENIIMVSKYNSVIDDIYSNYEIVVDLINEILKRKMKIVVLNEERFKEEVNNYKIHLSNPSYYKYIEENKSLINYQQTIEKKDNLGYTNLVNKAIDVLGDEIVEIE